MKFLNKTKKKRQIENNIKKKKNRYKNYIKFVKLQ